jgi:hypothetical protein
MDEIEFNAWLDTCPTHHWEITYSEPNGITVNFQITSNENEKKEK